MRKRCLSMQKLVYQHPKCPNIGLRSINIIDQSLRRHIDRRAYINILELTLGKFSKSEICYFRLPFLYENVGHFEISMYYIILREVHQPFENIANIPISFELLQTLLRPQFTLQIPLIAVLGNDVAVAIAGEDLEASEYIGMIELFEDIDF